jgi:hypothetical protein
VHWSQRVEDPQARLSEIAKGLEWFQEIIVISSERKSTLCFVKGIDDQLYTDLFLHTTKEYLCYIEYPVTAPRDHALINLIGPPKDVERLIEFVGEWGATFEVEAITDYHTKDRGVLTALTNKQLAALRLAHRKGFFDHPRRNDARELSAQMGIRHTTFLTHIRRGQKRMLDELFRE